MSENLPKKLDRLADFQGKRDCLSLEKQELIDQIIPPEIRARLDEIEAEFTGRLEAVNENIETLEAEIRQDVLREGASYRGTFLQAVWCKGRVGWNNQELERYAREHPELLQFRKQSEPYITIRKI